MEAWFRDRNGAENLFLQKLEELLERKEREIASLELEVHSSRKKLKNFKKNIEKYGSSNYNNTAMEEKEKGCYGNALAIWMPTNNEKSPCSKTWLSDQLVGKSSVNCSKGKRCSKSSESNTVMLLSWIEERLRILEEEGEIMKEEFVGSVEDRRKLINEIYQQCQIICSRLGRKAKEEESGDGTLVANPSKCGSLETGLLQVIREHSNPSLITTGFRMKNPRFPELDRVVQKFSDG